MVTFNKTDVILRRKKMLVPRESSFFEASDLNQADAVARVRNSQGNNNVEPT